jgi:hypothetical protein
MSCGINRYGDSLCSEFFFRSTVPGFDGLDAIGKRLLQNILADGSKHEAEQPSLEILTLANHIDINVRGAVVLLVSAYLSAQGFARKKLNLT